MTELSNEQVVVENTVNSGIGIVLAVGAAEVNSFVRLNHTEEGTIPLAIGFEQKDPEDDTSHSIYLGFASFIGIGQYLFPLCEIEHELKTTGVFNNLNDAEKEVADEIFSICTFMKEEGFVTENVREREVV